MRRKGKNKQIYVQKNIFSTEIEQEETKTDILDSDMGIKMCSLGDYAK